MPGAGGMMGRMDRGFVEDVVEVCEKIFTSAICSLGSGQGN
jgi:hypothetical protein